jgi:hypothetical protein
MLSWWATMRSRFSTSSRVEDRSTSFWWRGPSTTGRAKGTRPKPICAESYVIEEARKAGFVLEAKSEINANPKDTRDHPFGVWTLPPTRRSAPAGQPTDPNFDHAKYDVIGLTRSALNPAFET